MNDELSVWRQSSPVVARASGRQRPGCWPAGVRRWQRRTSIRARNTFPLYCDVSDDKSVRQAVQVVADRLGGIDILVSNAGVGAIGAGADNSYDQWHQVLDGNVVGTVRVSRAAPPYLRRSTNVAIVNTCSIAATVGLPQRALYSAMKGAVFALTLAMATDHLADGIRVNCVAIDGGMAGLRARPGMS